MTWGVAVNRKDGLAYVNDFNGSAASGRSCRTATAGIA
jgi:hypothetical protein